jgi:hypothetical protein
VAVQQGRVQLRPAEAVAAPADDSSGRVGHHGSGPALALVSAPCAAGRCARAVCHGSRVPEHAERRRAAAAAARTLQGLQASEQFAFMPLLKGLWKCPSLPCRYLYLWRRRRRRQWWWVGV